MKHSKAASFAAEGLEGEASRDFQLLSTMNSWYRRKMYLRYANVPWLQGDFKPNIKTT